MAGCAAAFPPYALESENMRREWKRVKANKGAPGVDGMRIEDFAEFARSA